SDIRYKQNISPIASAMEYVNSINGVYFDWNTEDYDQKGFNENRQIGFIAQEIEEVLPELVETDEQGYKSVDYSKITAVLIQAMKEQQTEIDDLRKENLKISELEEKLQLMEERLIILDNLISK
ncbi:MAG: tail fiber domain-containing protein, partial [Bacteroidales bacterium]